MPAPQPSPPPIGPLVDTHAHLADERLAADLPAVLRRAREAGVVQVLTVATTAADAAIAVGQTRRIPGVFAAVAIHPNHGAEAAPGDFERIELLAGSESGVVAVGETGLDRYRDRTPFTLQQELFDRHLDLAQRLGRPVIIHCRDCYADVIAQLQRRPGPTRGVLHSFTGSRDDAQALLGLGLHISFAGMITFGNKDLDALRDVAAEVPTDRLLVETDSPYLSPHPLRGRPNEPARVAWTAAKLAELRGVAPEALAAATTANARALFRLPADAILPGPPG